MCPIRQTPICPISQTLMCPIRQILMCPISQILMGPINKTLMCPISQILVCPISQTLMCPISQNLFFTRQCISYGLQFYCVLTNTRTQAVVCHATQPLTSRYKISVAPKIGNVRITQHWGAFVQPLLQQKSNKYYIFWVCVCSLRYPSRNLHVPYCHLCTV
jgi:hypothetical protein